MEAFEKFIEDLSGFIWGGSWGGTEILPVGPVTVLLLGTGLYFMIRLAGRPLKRFFPTLGEVWRSRKGDGDPSTITAWQALSTALSGQVGTGNLAGVATAITLGGPGAIFWMWITALFGMSLAFAESSLAIKFREKDSNGRPMYYIKNGLGKNWTWLAVIFCIGTMFSATATGGMVQANSITQTVVRSGGELGIGVPTWSVGLILAVLTFAVIIGGIKSIGNVAGKVVPLMALFYVSAAFIVLVMNISEVPSAFALIVKSAFGWQEAAGGFTGVMMQQAIRAGVARGLFSNEAGQGSAPIAHAAAQTKNPIKQGEIAMVGVFIDTLVICTMTALVILSVPGDFKSSPSLAAYQACSGAGLVSLPDGAEEADYFPGAYVTNRADKITANGAAAVALLTSCQAANAASPAADRISDSILNTAAIDAAGTGAVLEVDRAWKADLEASAITNQAYASALPGGGWIITICLALFAFTTIIGWSYYAEQAITFLLGEWATMPFRFVWVFVIFYGALAKVGFVWLFGDLANASMAFPNLIAIIALSGVVMAMHRKNGDPDTENGDSVMLKGEGVQ
jgi:AGCS family alanine or glycine:cation symporter